MAGNGYLRTVNFGGFDKKDVLAYVDELNTKIYNLETQLGEKNDTIAALEASGAGAAPSGDFEGKEILEQKIEEGQKKLEESHAKVSELMASTDSLKLQLTTAESDAAEKDNEIAQLKKEIEDLKQKVSDAEASAAAGGGAAFDMSSLFMEAQKSANAVVAQAKEAAAKMEQDAKNLQDQILEDANNQAEKIVNTANAEAKTTTESAQAQADTILKSAREQEGLILAQSKDVREAAQAELTDLDINVRKLEALLNDLLSESTAKTEQIKKLTEDGLKLVNSNSNFNYSPKGSDVARVNVKNDTGKINEKSAKSDNDILAELAQQALNAVQNEQTAPKAAPQETAKPAQSADAAAKPSIGRSLQFREPAPDSVKPQPKKAEEVKTEAPKMEQVKAETPKAEEVKTEEPKKDEGKPTFHMAAQKSAPAVAEEKHEEKAAKPSASSLGLSMSKDANKPSGRGPKSADPVTAEDKDMMASLMNRMKSGDSGEDSKSDDDILSEWGEKKQ